MFSLCIALLVGLLLTGAAIDIGSRRLPNWLTAAVAALYGLYVVVSPTPVDWVNAFLIAGLIFAIGFTLFAFNLIGGGDVKLIAALALWAGIDHIALFLLVTSLSGGLLSIGALIRRQWAGSMLVALFWPVYRTVASGSTTAPTPIDDTAAEAGESHADPAESLPYGVAIAAGGLSVIYALLQL